MSTPQEANKATFQRVLDAANSHDEELLLKTVADVFDPDVELGTPLPIQASGCDAIKAVFSTLHRAFPDLHIKVEDVIAEGDKVVTRHTVSGTHRGEYMGLAPTGRSVSYKEIFIFRFVDGRIAKGWGVVDVLSQLKQLGAIER